jgi:hypothetical protein
MLRPKYIVIGIVLLAIVFIRKKQSEGNSQKEKIAEAIDGVGNYTEEQLDVVRKRIFEILDEFNPGMEEKDKVDIVAYITENINIEELYDEK